ncbi:acyl-CoA dehydrogenase family protein [Luedemannella helvata]|uniref:Acyl-CoA dehydrogenase n=1 Tax=Luedemannella helvata TaxID=349315 RepID=A0ABP4X1D5_9ACTN
MTATALLAAGTTSVVASLTGGAVPWHALHPFPVQDRAEVELGDDAARRMISVLRDVVDPVRAEEAGTWPAGLPAALHAAGLLHLVGPPAVGGAGLSPLNTQRVLTAAAGYWRPAAFMLGVHNGIGAPAVEPLLGAGPLGEHVRARLRAGAVTGMADTEPEGAANRDRFTRAEPTADGFRLTGDKSYIGNAAVADLLLVTAQHGRRPRLFVVDLPAPGFAVVARHEYPGLRGYVNAAVRLRDVPVPAHQLVPDDGDRMSPALVSMLAAGRLHIVTPVALASARECLTITRAYLGRRHVDGVRLTGYEEPRRMTAEAMADGFALETAARWAMLGTDRAHLVADQAVIKTVSAELAWRVAEHTMTTTAAQGWERARSKAARGLPREPVEQIHRDVRGLRIAGGTEVLLRQRTATAVALAPRYTGRVPAADSAAPAARADLAGRLSATNAAHLDGLEHAAARVAALLDRAVAAHPDPAALAARQRLVTLTGRAMEDLLTTALTLARTGSAAAAGYDTQDLCDLHSRRALRRLAVLTEDLDAELRRTPDGVDERVPAWVDGAQPADALLEGAGV